MYNIKPLLASLFVLIGVGILCTLGTWQVQRLHWKNDIIERLSAARAAPQALDFAALTSLATTQDLPLAYGKVKGTLLSDKEILVGPKTDEDGNPGYHLITPLKMADGGTVLINRGWVPAEDKDPANRTALRAPSSVSVTFTGVARRPDKNAFTSGNSPSNNMWFYTDTAQIATAQQLGATAPLVLYAETSNRKFDGHAMNPPGWAPRNKHLQYAIFWYAMAAALVGCFFFIRQSHKKNRNDSSLRP